MIIFWSQILCYSLQYPNPPLLIPRYPHCHGSSIYFCAFFRTVIFPQTKTESSWVHDSISDTCSTLFKIHIFCWLICRIRSIVHDLKIWIFATTSTCWPIIFSTFLFRHWHLHRTPLNLIYLDFFVLIC